MQTTSETTTNHDVMRRWIEDRHGVPACVAATNNDDDVGVLRVHFPGQGSGDQLDEISWEDFFAKFEEADLMFLYDVHTSDGALSRFSKFVQR